MRAQRYQVIIVGGGPVGMALAVELGQRGVTCAVIEPGREVSRIPKGQYLAPRSLEHFYFWNCLDAVRGARLLPAGYPAGGIRVFGDLTSDYWVPVGYHEDSQGLFFQRNERLPQYLTENVLRARARALASVTLRLGDTATGIEQDDAGVRVTLRRGENPREHEVLHTEYLVGCDGAHSQVRRKAGIGRHGSDLRTKMVLAVFSSPALHSKLKRFGERSTYQIISPELRGVWRFFGRVEAGISWFYHGPVPQDTAPGDHAYIHRAMEKAAGFSFPVEFWHTGFWDLRADVADDYRRGRVFLAGDAAHSHPPYGAHGLNSGLEDAANLGWKLAAVLGGWGGGALLDSYGAERRPVAAQTAEDVIVGGILRDRDWLERHSPERDGAGFAGAWRRYSARGWGDFDPHYAGSPVVAGLPGGSTGVHGVPSPAARAGHHVASLPFAGGGNVFEYLGNGFTLIASGRDEAAVAPFAGAARRLGVPLKIVRAGRDVRDTYGCDLVLARPDQFVAWAGDTAPPDPGQVLGQITGTG